MPAPPAVIGQTSLTQRVQLVLEPTAGEQLLMPTTAGAATMSLTTQPNTLSPTTGMHLHFYIIGNATTGSITVAGTAPVTGNAVNSITYHLPVAPQNNQGYTEFTTKEVFATVNASGIVLTTLTPCQVIVYGSYAGKFLIPITADAEEHITHFAPVDKRGILFSKLRVTQATKGASIDKFDAALYPDSLWAAYMLIGNTPVITTLPTVATTKLASTVIGATMTITTPPAAPGEFLIFAITTNTALGTIVLNGLDNYGNPATETINFTAAATQTVYSTKRYSSLTVPGSNQFTTTGGASAHIAVTGVYAWIYTWTYDGLTNPTPYSASLEVFNGVFGYMLPYSHFSDGTFDWQKEKEILFTGKGLAQDYCIVGDNTSTTGGVNPFAVLAQPTSIPVVSWPASFYIDVGTGTPFTTQDGSIETFKLQLITGRKPFYSSDTLQRWSNVTWDSEPDFALDATHVLQNYANYVNYFKPNSPLILGVTFQGNMLGNIGGTTYYEQWQWTLPAKVDTYKPDMTHNPVDGILKLMASYDFSNLGYGYKLAVTAQQPPTYTS